MQEFVFHTHEYFVIHHNDLVWFRTAKVLPTQVASINVTISAYVLGSHYGQIGPFLAHSCDGYSVRCERQECMGKGITR